MAENNSLFGEFKPISYEEWHAQVIKDLKGADYGRKVVWNTLEGISLEPFYRFEDVKDLAYSDALPGEKPFVRGSEPSHSWKIRQDFRAADPAEANRKALKALQKGAQSLGFVTCTPLTYQQLETLLNGIDLTTVPVHIVGNGSDASVPGMMAEYAAKHHIDPNAIKGSSGFDPLAFLMLSGKTPCNSDSCQCVESAFAKAGNTLPNFKLLNINARHIHNAGGSIVQELATGLAMGAEYLQRLTDAGHSFDDVAPRMLFVFAQGSNYFMEIAKLRAARLLWSAICDEFNPKSADSGHMCIFAETSEWNKTIYDPYVNILRATTEAMSGALGGASAICVQPFDAVYSCSDDFSERIARNIQIILKEEAHFDKVNDPAAGSYYIEHLTKAIAEEAWKLFLQIQDLGGFTPAFRQEFIQKFIDETLAKRNSNVETRREIILGTNQYPNFNEKVDAARLKKPHPVLEGGIRPIRLHRAAEAFEAMRLKTDSAARKINVFMLKIGNVAMRQARAQFAANFFACAGFRIIDNLGYETVAEGVNDALAAKADIVVMCSSDDEYALLAPEMFGLLGNKAISVIAGNPACRPELEAAGISNYIHVKSNLLAELKQYQQKLGL